MHPSRFCEHVLTARRGRRLLARIALNTLGYAKDYPVDIHELRLLPEENRAMLAGLLDFTTTHKGYRIGLPHIWQMKQMADPEPER